MFTSTKEGKTVTVVATGVVLILLSMMAWEMFWWADMSWRSIRYLFTDVGLANTGGLCIAGAAIGFLMVVLPLGYIAYDNWLDSQMKKDKEKAEARIAAEEREAYITKLIEQDKARK